MIFDLIFRQPKYEVAVVIPIYRNVLTEYESISLDRCLKVLGNHRIVILSQHGLEIDGIDQLKNHEVITCCFDRKYFSSVDGYNRLMLSTDFYRSFISYRYILIYQLDAFVFSDQLLDWCRLSYDYIGAPWIGVDWIQGIQKAHFGYLWRFTGKKERTVGNGGFSLRRVRAFMLALLLLKNAANKWGYNEHEDLFWSLAVPDYLPFFRIPDDNVALNFAFEANPRTCFEINNHLPFGCHAWEKHDTDFWRPVFKGLGYSI